MPRMRLYHYTSSSHLRLILASRVLRTTESNVSLDVNKPHAGRDVVWLTSEADPTGHGHGLDGSSVNKREVRITVEVEDEDVWLWRPWALRQGSTRATVKRLAQAGGGGDRTWHVVERPIPITEWVQVRNMVTGKVLLDRGTLAAAAAAQRSPSGGPERRGPGEVVHHPDRSEQPHTAPTARLV